MSNCSLVLLVQEEANDIRITTNNDSITSQLVLPSKQQKNQQTTQPANQQQTNQPPKPVLVQQHQPSIPASNSNANMSSKNDTEPEEPEESDTGKYYCCVIVFDYLFVSKAPKQTRTRPPYAMWKQLEHQVVDKIPYGILSCCECL